MFMFLLLRIVFDVLFCIFMSLLLPFASVRCSTLLAILGAVVALLVACLFVHYFAVAYSYPWSSGSVPSGN